MHKNKHIGIISNSMRYYEIIMLIVALLIVVGVYSLYKMPRQEFPEMTIWQGLVIGVYPGATSEEVESQLTKPIERYLFGFDEINKKKTWSMSKNGMMIIFAELNTNVKQPDEFWAKLNHGLNMQKMQLPKGVVALTADNDFGNTSALLITLEADDKSYKEMEPYLTHLEDNLRKIEEISKVKRYGLQKEQISVYLDNDKLTYFNIKPSMLYSVLATEGAVTTSGQIKNGTTVTPLHLSPGFETEKDVAEQIIYSDPSGTVVRLKDVARIVREYPEPESYFRNNGHNCLMLSIEMTPGFNIVHFGKKVDKVIADFKKDLPENVHIARIADMPKSVDNSIKVFLKEFVVAIIAVILVIMLLLPFRVAAVAAITIPVTIFITIGMLYAKGIELTTVSLAALIAVLGMIVDNAIVVIDNHVEKLDSGRSRWGAAAASARELFIPVTAATAAIMIIFVPFPFFVKGNMKEFIGDFSPTIWFALGISLLVTMFMIPYVNYLVIKTGLKVKNDKKQKTSVLTIVQQLYDTALEIVFRFPKTTLLTGSAITITGIILFMFIPNRLYPVVERSQFAIEIYTPQGSSVDATADVVDSLENILLKDKRIVNVTSCIGSGSPRFHTTYAPHMPAENYAQLIINTVSNEATVDIIRENEKKYGYNFAQAYIRFKQLDYMNVSAPIEVRLSGDSINDIRAAAELVKKELRSIPGITWVRDNFEESKPVLGVDVNRIEANRLGFTKTAISTGLQIRTGGLPLTTMWEDDYPVNVVLKTEKADRKTAGELEDLYVTSALTRTALPLRQIASIEPQWSEGQIIHRNGIRTMSVYGDLSNGIIASTKFPEVERKMSSIILPHGVNLTYGGEHELDSEEYAPLIKAVVVGVVCIFFVLLFQFRKIRLALLIMITILLSIPGASFGAKIMGSQFGATALLGIVSLFGIVVRNGIILIDYTEKLRSEKGLCLLEAIKAGARRRMRPIFLTAAAASVGVIPMMLGKSPMWSPLGTVVFFGTMVSMVLTIFIVPVAYWYVMRGDERKIAKKASGV